MKVKYVLVGMYSDVVTMLFYIAIALCSLFVLAKEMLTIEKTMGEITPLNCPKCGGHDITIKNGMFVDLYTCNECGCEWRP